MDRRRDLIEKQASKAGMRGKINAKCIECIYDDIGGNGTWREQVGNCTSVDCPLFSVRPTSSAAN